MVTKQQDLHFLDVLDNSIASLKLPFLQTNISEIEIIQKIHQYFASVTDINDRSNRSADEKKMIDFIQTRLQHLANNSQRIQVNQNQLKMLFDLPADVDILQLLPAYYACFYLAPLHSESTVGKTIPLLNELLCAAYYEIISKMTEKKLPYYENLAQRVIMESETTNKEKTGPIKEIINEVAAMFNLTAEDIIVYFENRLKHNETFENWPGEYLLDYVQMKKDPNQASFDDFLREKNLREYFNDDEVSKYNLLFNSYVRKLVDGQIGKFVLKEVTVLFARFSFLNIDNYIHVNIRKCLLNFLFF